MYDLLIVDCSLILNINCRWTWKFVSECVHLLLAHGAPVKIKNLAGWSPLSEAISYGDRQTSTCNICRCC